ncbi:MAG: VOC family protein, partial [Actinoallomurus sp.]
MFNDGLRLRRAAREVGEKCISDGELSRRLITEAELTPEREWLGEVSAVVLQQALADLNTAYRNFFALIAGKRKGRRVALPRFRSRKDNRQVIRFTKNSRFKVLDNGKLRLPKIGDLAVRWSRSLPFDPSSVVLDCPDAGELARFYRSLLGGVVDQADPRWAVGDAFSTLHTGSGLVFCFQRVEG